MFGFMYELTILRTLISKDIHNYAYNKGFYGNLFLHLVGCVALDRSQEASNW